MADANFNALPSLKRLGISFCGITGKWLSVMLRHAPALEELDLVGCDQISGLLMGETESRSLSHSPTPRASSASNPDGASTSSTSKGLLRIPSNLIPCLKEIIIVVCGELTFQGDKDCFSGFISLEKLTIWGCRKLISSLVHKNENSDQRNGRWLLPHSLVEFDIHDCSLEALQLCFLEDRNCLKKLHIGNGPCLKSLQLRSCTALEELVVHGCESLDALEDFRSLRGLRYLDVFGCPGLSHYLERLSSQGRYGVCAGLERLVTDDYSFLATSFCKCLTSLRRLEFFNRLGRRLTDEQDSALQLLTSLQELQFRDCYDLAYLPVGLHSLSSLKRLEIHHCWSISRLPVKGLPPSLEELDIRYCTEELTEQCRMLAKTRSKPRVKIGWEYVNCG